MSIVDSNHMCESATNVSFWNMKILKLLDQVALISYIKDLGISCWYRILTSLVTLNSKSHARISQNKSRTNLMNGYGEIKWLTREYTFVIVKYLFKNGLGSHVMVDRL